MNDPKIKMAFDEQQLPADPPYVPQPNALPLAQLLATFPLMTYKAAPPTNTPRHLGEQFALYYSGTHLNLCVYDPTFALWFYLDLSSTSF